MEIGDFSSADRREFPSVENLKYPTHEGTSVGEKPTTPPRSIALLPHASQTIEGLSPITPQSQADGCGHPSRAFHSASVGSIPTRFLMEFKTEEDSSEFSEKMAELMRNFALQDCEIRFLCYNDYSDDVDKWDILKEATFKDIEYAHGDIHVWFTYEFTVSKHVARATRWQPAEYKNVPHIAYMSINWSMVFEDDIYVDIEVEPK